MKDFGVRVWDLLTRWEAAYREEAEASDRIPPVLFCSGEEGQEMDEEELERACKREYVDARVGAVRNSVIHKMMDGETRENDRRIERYLASQRVEPCGAADGAEPRFTLVFESSYPPFLIVQVDSLLEYDMVDNWDDCPRQCLFVHNPYWKRWTRNRIEKVLGWLEYDFGFDGYDLHDVQVEEGECDGLPGRKGIRVRYEVREMDFGDEDDELDGEEGQEA